MFSVDLGPTHRVTEGKGVTRAAVQDEARIDLDVFVEGEESRPNVAAKGGTAPSASAAHRRPSVRRNFSRTASRRLIRPVSMPCDDILRTFPSRQLLGITPEPVPVEPIHHPDELEEVDGHCFEIRSGTDMVPATRARLLHRLGVLIQHLAELIEQRVGHPELQEQLLVHLRATEEVVRFTYPRCPLSETSRLWLGEWSACVRCSGRRCVKPSTSSRRSSTALSAVDRAPRMSTRSKRRRRGTLSRGQLRMTIQPSTPR